MQSEETNPVIYAVGDVHGRDDLLEKLHGQIIGYHQLHFPRREGEVVYVGDYIDRGRQSAEVIDRLMRGLDGMKSTCLLGNHEAMMMECLVTDSPRAWRLWLSNGGGATLQSLGLSPKPTQFDPLSLAAALGPDRIGWLRSLPLHKIIEPYLFVHAGIVPGVPLEEQRTKDILWIRDRFLNNSEDHGHTVVHGHTWHDEPIVKPNRICIDTGAVHTGVLVAAILDGRKPPAFLRARS